MRQRAVMQKKYDGQSKAYKRWSEKGLLDTCKYGPMGEDLFVEMCMKKNGVTGTEVFDITSKSY